MARRRVRKQVLVGAAVLIAAVALLAAKAIGGGNGGEGLPETSLETGGAGSRAGQPNQQLSPTQEPPKSFVFDRTTASDNGQRQGYLTYYEWTVGDEEKAFDRSQPPYKWPKALTVSSPANIGIEFRAEPRPAQVIIQVWNRIGADGSLAGHPQLLTCGVANSPEGTCRVVPGSDEARTWHAVLGFSLERGEYFLSASGMWSPQGPSGKPNTASWIYRVMVE